MHRRLLPLPVEILDEIVSHSGDDQQILRSLRASSYALSSYATPKVFRRLVIRQGMDDSTCASIRALLLSNSPVLAHVKEVEFIVGGFDDYSEEEITIFGGAVMDSEWTPLMPNGMLTAASPLGTLLRPRRTMATHREDRHYSVRFY